MLSTDLELNNYKMRQPFNIDEPVKSVYTRLNECIDYANLAGKPITEEQVVRIAYGLIAETGQFQEN